MVEESGKPTKNIKQNLVVLDLGEYLPDRTEIASIDLKDFLFKGLVLREKEFRQAIKNFDFSQFQSKYVAVHCSSEAIVPMWAYMVVAAELQAFVQAVEFCSPEEARDYFFLFNIRNIKPEAYADQRVVVKGCGNYQPKEAIYIEITARLSQKVRALLFGEPCSTVPVYRKKA